MRTPRHSKKNPQAVMSPDGKKLYLRQDVVEWMLKDFLKEAVDDFREAHHKNIEEKLKEDDDLDIRFENSITDMNVKIIQTFTEKFIKKMNHVVNNIAELVSDDIAKEDTDGRK